MTRELQNPFFKRLMAWVFERFPPASWTVFILMYLCCSLYGQAIAGVRPLSFGWRELCGSLSSIAFFLFLRILDEHKDFAKDTIHHPERVLQRGLIQLRHLRILAIFALIGMLSFSIACDHGIGAVTLSFALALIWVCLMTKEFFCPVWLNQRLVIYAVSHMLVMPFVAVWFLLSAMPAIHLSPLILWISLAIFFSGFTFEITRKTKGIEEEIAGVDTYSSLLGRTRSSITAWTLLAIELFCKFLLVQALSPQKSGLYGIIFSVFALLAAISFGAYLKKPTAKSRKGNEGIVGLSSLVSYIAILVAVLMEYGFTVSSGF